MGERESPGHLEAANDLERELPNLPPEQAEVIGRAIDEMRERARSGRSVEIMVAGAGVYICDQCVEGCVEYIKAVREERSSSPS